MKNLAFFVVASLLLSGVPNAGAAPIVDDFNDNLDDGWFRYMPLGVNSATYTLQNGTYQIEAAVTPNPAFGAGRAGSLRLDQTYSDFTVAVDVVDFDESLLQAFGSLARITSPGATTTRGYGFVYDNESDEITIVRIDGEVPTAVGTPTGLILDANNDYRFVFTGTGSNFVGEVFDLSNGGALLGTIIANDATYASGVTGLVSASLDDLDPADATFDNYSAVPEPSGVAFFGVVGLGFCKRRRQSRSRLCADSR